MFAKIIDSFSDLYLDLNHKRKYTALCKVDQYKTSFTVRLVEVTNNLTCA